MKDHQTADVLVVGGGPAGLLAAETAASAGLSTVVVEREQEIGHPVHTSGATALKTMTDFEIPEHLYHPVGRFRVCSPNEEALFESEEPIGCVIDVRGVYKFLAKRAELAGAYVVTGAQATEPLVERGFVIGCNIRTGTESRYEVRSKVLIDASGYRAGVSKQAGFNRFGVGAEYELVTPNCRQDEAVLIVGRRYAPSGYAWVLPWGDNRVRVGVGVLHGDTKDHPKDYLLRLMKEAGRFRVDLEGAEIAEYHFGLIPSDGVAEHLVGNGIMAVGDAGGKATLVAGEGIRLSMRVGRLAGQVAAKAIINQSWGRDDLLPYERSFRSGYGRNISIGHVVNRRMADWEDAKWDERVRLVKTLPTPLFAKLIQSEFSALDILRWMATQPTMWPRAARYGVRLVGRLASRG